MIKIIVYYRIKCLCCKIFLIYKVDGFLNLIVLKEVLNLKVKKKVFKRIWGKFKYIYEDCFMLFM